MIEMINNPFLLISVLFSSVFSFFSTAFFVDILIKTFRVQQHRLKATLKMIPLISLIISFFSNQCSLAYWMNPLSCASCLQKLFSTLFSADLKVYLTQNHISLASYLGTEYQHSFLSSFGYIWGMVSLFFILGSLIRIYISTHKFYRMIKRASLYKEMIPHGLANRLVEKKGVKIFVSDEVSVPLALHPKYILIPKGTIHSLSLEELEGVIAHEWEHIRCKDSLVRGFCYLTSIFFWWVPMRFWLKKIEQDQEMACDQNVSAYGISHKAIASALCKVAKKTQNHQMFCCFAIQKHPIVMRIEMLLGLRKKTLNPLSKLSFLGVCFGGVLLVLCGLYF